jgi:hypothetical protein
LRLCARQVRTPWPYGAIAPELEPYLAESKMQEIIELEDGFKRKYLLSAFVLMMKDHGSNFDFEGADMGSMKARMHAVA